MERFYLYARFFLTANGSIEKAQVFNDAIDWLESKAETTIDKGLKTRVFAILCTREGEDFLRWVTGNDGENVQP